MLTMFFIPKISNVVAEEDGVISNLTEEEIKQYDKFFSKSTTDTEYNLKVPDLAQRLTLNADKTKATLFAPYITKTSGWIDVNKVFDETDSALCWVTNSSNGLSWYLKSCQKTSINDVSSNDVEVEDIFQNYKDNWKNDGYDYMQGMAWYFTGKTMDGTNPVELKNQYSGGFLKNIEHCGAN